MRHLRIPGQNIKNLTTYQSQLSRFIIKRKRSTKRETDSHLKTRLSNENDAGTSGSTAEQAPSKAPVLSRRKQQLNKHLAKPTKKMKAKLKFAHDNIPVVKKMLFKCSVCDITQNFRTSMLKHLETHTGTPLSCLKCKSTFNGSVSYNWHLVHYCKQKVKEFKFKCDQCPQEFVTRRSLLAHQQGHNRNNCTYCDKVITKRSHLIKHLLEVHQIKLERQTYKCEHCEKRYINKRNLYYHLQQHAPDKHVCLECGKIEDNPESFEEHKKHHDLQKNFVCSKCGDRFLRRQQYLIHLNRHNKYRCATCDENYASRDKILQHKQKGHEVEGLQPRFICPHCPALFQREGKLFLHMRKHNGNVRNINCKYCKKSFTSPYAYYKHCFTINHEKFSPEVSDIPCEFCNKRFRKKKDWKQHVYNVHNDKPKFTCQYCSYQTHHKTNMDRHVSVHFTKKEFTCEHCGRCCDSLASLKDHISYIHFQEKQFACEKCGKSFKRNSELIRHQKSHSNERPHTCTVCGKSYKRQTHLKRHEQSAHQIISQTRRVKRLIPEENSSEEGSASSPLIQENQLSQPMATTSNKNIIILHQHSFKQAKTHDAGKCDLSDSLFMSDSNNSNCMVDQLVSSLLPEREWSITENEAIYKVYNDVALNYGNQQLPVIAESVIESLPRYDSSNSSV